MTTQNIFQDEKKNKVENLLLAGIVSYYFTQLLLTLWSGGLFNNLGSDYLSFWSSGHIANNAGLSFVYDLQVQKQVQELYAPVEKISVVPTPLLPIFIIPFQLMATLPPGSSFLIWTLLNLSGLYIYLKKRILFKLPIKYVFMVMLAAPVFQNIYFGQVEVWLMIFASEFLISFFENKFFKSGVWLGLLLLKPQILILIIPYLILQRSWKTLVGFSVTSFLICVISFFLVGFDGLIGIKNLWLGYTAGLPSNAPEVMSNWRMLGLHFGELTSPFLGMLVIVLGFVFTLYLCLPLFKTRTNISPVIPLIGIFSATLAITWHSHQHMTMILIPFLYKALQLEIFPLKLFKAWVFIPIFTYMLIIPIALLIQIGVLSMATYGGLLTGTCMLIFNLLFIYTARNVINVYSNQ